MKTIKYFLTAIIALLVLNACSNDDEDIIVQKTKLTVNLIPPKNIEITEYKDVKVTFKEINTHTETIKDFIGEPLKLELKQGSYQISVNGKVAYTLEGEAQESNIGAFESQVTFNKAAETKDIQLSLSSSTQNDFIFGEIFFAGTRTPQGEQYLDDVYFKIHNNTDKVLYADGLIIVQSKFQTTDKRDYTPNIMSEAFTADAMIQIPGSGTDYPIQPGESFIVANQAINHKENNPNSFDLSKAKFEFYYEDSDDIDNPAVPNVINFRSKMSVNRQGINSFVIFRLPKELSKEEYLKDYKYKVSSPNIYFPNFPFEDDEYKVPNKWIVDAVNFSNQDEFQWIITDPSLDKGYASVGYNSYSSYGRSAKRKVIQDLNGKQFLQDTNDSSVDFEESDPSVANN